MIYLLVLSLMASSRSNILDVEAAPAAEPAGAPTQSPTIVKTVSLDDNAVHLEWSSVIANDLEPVGYKVIVWEMRDITSYHFEAIENGSHVLVHDMKEPGEFSPESSVTPDYADKIIIDVGNTNSFTLRKLKQGVWYEFRVLAYNKNGDGLMSNPLRYKIPRESLDQNEDGAKNEG